MRSSGLVAVPDRSEPLEVLYVGAVGGVEAGLVERAGLPFAAIPAGQLRIANPLRLARNLALMRRGAAQAAALLQRWQPDVVFVTGGYVCAPVVWAAHRRRIPILIYLPDLTPGLAVRLLARYADRVAVSFPEVTAHFRGRPTLVSGYPVRRALRRRTLDKAEARAHFALDPAQPTVLVFGGSHGAQAINQALAAILSDLLDLAQVIHISGERDHPAAQARSAPLSDAQRQRYRLFAYLHEEMPAALMAADLVVARAGASTLGEFPALGLPAVLVPLPLAGGHQMVNARYLADRGAAVIVADADLRTRLWPTLQALLSQPERLAAMSRASAALAQPDAADRLAQALLDLARSDHDPHDE
ncbi:MAG: UDP-N-acetylglucosamine--N-acetylmuramyl-(pentapeptide) pyrophosphoryl-undecaprenol N-acetylglucosamine transferase [Anaerolineae bacterium]|nr:UDP-N-acetylglucosamine--N-acetylmuramyl-(pentapeptide) pyrophosphoryl-undecaprenol N-acetylglucosamine transferase [Anaerolineae bacterium]